MVGYTTRPRQYQSYAQRNNGGGLLHVSQDDVAKSAGAQSECENYLNYI